MTETLQAGSAGSDAELITRVRAGDRAAYGELYARHSTAALTLARQFSRSPAEADDLVSESFARVLDTLIAGGGPDTAFRAYLFTTLRNTAYDRTRKDKRLSFTDDVEAHDVAVDVDDPVVLQAENSLVGKAFNALPERWQAVLWYTQVDGMSPAEAGVLLGMSANAVTSLAYRAREGLREAYLQAHLADTAAERCRTTVDRLGAWARGGLSKREQAQVDAHLAECDRCRALAAELSEINSGIRGMIAPLLLGGAAVAYLAATVVAPPLALVTAGTFLGAQSGGTAGATGAAAGSTGGAHAAGAGSVWSRPWVLASAGGAVVAVGAIVALIIALSGRSTPPGAANGPAVTSPTAASGTAQGSTGAGASGADTSGAGSTGAGSSGASGTGSSGAGATGTGTNGPGTTSNPAGSTGAVVPPVTAPGGTGDGSSGTQGIGSQGAGGSGGGGSPGGGAGGGGSAGGGAAGGGSAGSGSAGGGSAGGGGSSASSPVATAPPVTPGTTPAAQTGSASTPPPTTDAGGSTGGGPTSTAPRTTPTTGATSGSTAPTTGNPATSTTAPTTPTTPGGALLGVSLSAVVAPRAGGNGTVSFTVTNSGGTASAAARISLGDTLGASIVGGTASQSPLAHGLRRASFFELLTTSPAQVDSSTATSAQVDSSTATSAQVDSTAAPTAQVGSTSDPAAQVGSDLLDCSTQPGSCTLGPIDPGSVATVTLTIHIPVTAISGELIIDIGSDGLALRTGKLAFGESLSSLSLGSGANLVAGTSTTADLVGTPGDGVSDPIDVTIPRVHGDLLITTVPDTCAPAADGSDAVTCAPIKGTTAEYGEFGITLKASASGEQDLTATLPGGQQIPVYGPTGKPLDVTPLAPGSPVSLAGTYGGVQVGAQTLECAIAFVPRDWCAALKAMEPVDRPRPLTIPDGATVVAATLTWAAAGPATGDPSSLDRVTLHLGETSRAVAGSTPQGVSDIKDTLYVRTADVTDLVASGGSVWVDDIAARATLTNSQPMAGWTLDVIWYDPSAAVSTVSYGNPNALSSSSPKGTATTIAKTGEGTATFWVTLWAPDPWANKSVLAGGQPVKTGLIDGLVTEVDATGEAGLHTTGFNLIQGVTGRAGQEITLINLDGPAAEGFETSSRQDDLWIGPTLVIGQSGQESPAA